MTDIDNDRDLREQFARLREKERVGAPSFDATMSAAVARRRRPQRRWGFRVVAAAASLAAITLAYEYRQAAVRRERTRGEVRHQAVAGSAWSAPTDFLLDTPGSRLLRTIPNFGSGSWIGTSSTTLRPRNPS